MNDQKGLVEIKNKGTVKSLPVWQSVVKQVFDYLFSLMFLVISSPLLFLLFLLIKLSGKGPFIYTQDRIGINGEPFAIFKIRTMSYNSEGTEPLLSGNQDERITRIGRILRKYRIDEIPNFINVLTGDMSIVGPRPERRFFIDQIVKQAPLFTELHKVKPGITSWGQVRFGYASSVEDMIRRLEFDMYYIKHRSLLFDLKILFLTFITVSKGKGI
jgi:lipopolysaccharide/colanic/teichoic acid biosynthesis glycosyltransferase